MYRDGFKVRPYGEKGNGYDWLGLSIRAQKSPAAVSHDSGAWKVRLNQLIGEVRISQQNNPNLEDMANREGLVQNDAYSNFIKIIIKMIETFEVDRQYIFREYSKWKKEEEEKISVVSSVVQQVKEEMQTDKTNQVNNKEPSLNNRDFTADDYKNAIVKLDQERQAQELTNKLLMLYSSSGVMTSTFSHEIEGIRSKIGSRMQHLRASVRRVVGEYDGIEAFNPYTIMSSIEETDNLIDCWLGVLMNGARGNVIATERINIYKYIQKCIELWKPLLQTKRIAIILTQNDYELDEYLYKVAEIDLLIIINNFLLNSAYFLELGNISHREVTIRIEVKQSLIKLHMDNNGPPLDRVFYDNPDRIFEAGVSTKTIKTDNGLKKGSGIGLWIMRTVVHSLSGEIHCKDLKEGFGIEISLPK